MSYEGRHVVVTGGAGALGQAVTRRLEAQGATCHVPRIEEIDLTDEAAVVAYYDALPSVWASIHLAGGFAAGKLERTSLADLRAQLELNGATCFLCCREAARRMRAGGAGGRIVNVAARPAVVPSAGAGMAAYAASKAVVASLTGALAAELLEDGILVNAVVPSIMDTPANRRAMPAADFARWPKTDEVAAAIAFLASPDNALTSGALVPVYGRS
jgi:NAD(P)-dependent dehydrogenase (short-subunit alcohol dehydrogenase family)